MDLRIRFVQYNERLKLKKLFKLLIIILYSTAMLYQISDVIQNYLKYDSVTRFEINQKQFNPRIYLGYMPKVFKFRKLKKIYPEISHDNDYIKVMKINDLKVRYYEIQKIIFKYLLKLINELRFKEFLDITYGKNLIKSCTVFKNKQKFNCSESNYGIYILNTASFSHLFEIVFENKTNCLCGNNVLFAGGLEKIELELRVSGTTQVFMGNCKSRKRGNEANRIGENTKTEIGFTSYTYKKLNTYKQKCLEVNNQNLKNYSSGNCASDCLYTNLNKTYGCLPIGGGFIFQLDFELHLISRGYRTCNKNIDLAEEILRKCDDICLFECESVYYNSMIWTKEFQDRKVGTFVKIFPIKFPHFIYTETLNMDLDQLIYNCGGILGLWFGLSPLSLDDLVISLRSVRFKSIIVASIHFVLLIALMSKQILILFFQYLGRSLRSVHILLKSITKKLIDFIVYMFFELKRMITILYLFLLMRLNNRIDIE
jgi:hypothetical protein